MSAGQGSQRLTPERKLKPSKVKMATTKEILNGDVSEGAVMVSSETPPVSGGGDEVSVSSCNDTLGQVGVTDTTC